MSLHIYTVKPQPATRYYVELLTCRHLCKNPPRRLFTCGRCGRRRYARNMAVQVYYDGSDFWCRDIAACQAYKKTKGRKAYRRRKASIVRRTVVRYG